MKKKTLIPIIVIAIIILILAVIAGHILLKEKPSVQKISIIPERVRDIKIKPVIKREYGFAVDSFIVIKGKIKPKENLISILSEYNISYAIINQIIKKAKGVFNLREIRYGNKYVIFCIKDSLLTAKHFIYEHTPIEYVVFNLKDSVQISIKEKEITAIKKTASGTVQTSLWNTIIDNDFDPILALELSEIYGWTIDLYKLNKGDKFKVIYEVKYIDSLSLGIGRILGACINHQDKNYYAVPFLQDSVEGYFDENGNSLQRLFLKVPLRYSQISSKFSRSRWHPILKIRKPHLGVDFDAKTGTPIHSVGDGVVIKALYIRRAGRMVKIKHDNVYTTVYLHLSRYGEGIKKGVNVKQGDIIGYVGRSGRTTGPHLHFEIQKNGIPVDPLKIELPPLEPIKEENIESFNKIKEKLIEQLDSIKYK